MPPVASSSASAVPRASSRSVPDELPERGQAPERLLHRLGVERHADRTRPDDGSPGVAHRLADRERDRPVDRADEQHRDLLALEPAGNDSRVRRIGEVLQRHLAAARRLEGLLRSVALLPHVLDLAIQVRPLGVVHEPLAGEADADEDPDHERDEDGRQRRDVVAEVEHGRSVGARLPPAHRLRTRALTGRACRRSSGRATGSRCAAPARRGPRRRRR